MQTFHDPDRFMADLRQVLSQGRKRIGLIVGAGAPMSIRVDLEGNISDTGKPLIPGVDELTALVAQRLEDEPGRVAIKQISASLGGTPNIEQILSQVRLLEKALGDTLMHGLDSKGYAALGEKICKHIGNIAGAKLPPQRSAYNDLVSWISGTLRTHAVEIFCPNYDLLLEEAFELARAPYFDGFTGGASPFFDPVTVASDDLPPRWSRLWKLHGSLGWAVEGNNIVRKGGRAASNLIFPDHLKYDLTQKQPYTALFERLRQFLASPDTLLMTTGFSFRDAHISAVIEESLATNANAAAIAFQYNELGKEEPACRIARDRPNLSVYAADGAIINGVVGQWRPGETNRTWLEIRPTFWASTEVGKPPCFLLGDFSRFARFCALSQATEMALPTLPVVVPSPPSAEPLLHEE